MPAAWSAWVTSGRRPDHDSRFKTRVKEDAVMHSLPGLPYEPDALAPHISAETLEYHWGKHHRAYVDGLNRLIPGTPFAELELEEIVRRSSGAIFNNAAQHFNHGLYWR